MVSRFTDKYNQDLELIYAKYSNPFDGAPELTLSTCDLPENVQIIKNHTYSNCGTWKVCDNNYDDSSDDTSNVNNCDNSDEENQSSYDSDDHSDCSGSFKLGNSFREKYPRVCAKKGLKTPPFNSSKKSTDVAKTPPSNHNLAYKQCCYEQTTSKIASRYYSSDETVTISKDLWSQVQQCLRLMTSVFTQLNSESNNENDSKKLCKKKPSQGQPNSIRKSFVKQRLFNDANTSCAGVPQGLVVEKLFVRHKASSRPGVELAQRQTFICDTKSKISEIESLESGLYQKNNNDVDASTQQCNSPSSCRMDGSANQSTMVSQTSEGSCSESSCPKSSVANSFMMSGSKQLSPGVSCSDSSQLLSPKVFAEHNQASSEKKRRRRYRLVRRRSTSCKTRGGSTSETPTSEKPTSEKPTSDHESDTQETQHFARNELYPCPSTGTSKSDTRRKIHHVARNGHSFDQCLDEDFHIPEKTKTTMGSNQNECCSSPEMHDVMLVEAPPTPVVHNKVSSPQAIPRHKTPSLTTSSQENCHSGSKRSLITESSQGYCCSSTPRKHLGVNNVTTLPDPEVFLRRPLFQQNSRTSAESMPSPIRSTLNTNRTETLVNHTLLSNADHLTLSSHKPQSIKGSLPSPISSKSSCVILQPKISVNFLRTKDIEIRSSSATNKGQAEPNIGSGQNNDGYTKKLFPGLSKNTSHIPSNDLFKQNTEQDYLSNKGHSKNTQRGSMMSISNVRSPNSMSTRSCEVQICGTERFSEPDYGRSKSRRVLCATTDRQLVRSPLTQVHNSESSPTKESLTTSCERKSKVTTPEKLNSSDRFTSPKNHPLKITPRRAKFHPYATSSKFPRTPSRSSPFRNSSSKSPSLISPLRDLTIKSPSSPCPKWTTLDRSPMAICVKQARRMSDPVVASRKILEFGSHDACSDFGSDKEKIKSREERESDQIKNEPTSQYPRKKLREKRNSKIDCRVEDDESRSNCSNGKCTKTFCFNCSMMDLS